MAQAKAKTQKKAAKVKPPAKKKAAVKPAKAKVPAAKGKKTAPPAKSVATSAPAKKPQPKTGLKVAAPPVKKAVAKVAPAVKKAPVNAPGKVTPPVKKVAPSAPSNPLPAPTRPPAPAKPLEKATASKAPVPAPPPAAPKAAAEPVAAPPKKEVAPKKPAAAKEEKAKAPIVAVMTGVDPLGSPARTLKRAMKERFSLEFYMNATPGSLYDMLSSPSGLSEWFCDDVDVRGEHFTFRWGMDEQIAQCLSRKFGELMRFQWEDDEDQGSYFELRIRVDPMTNETCLVVTDHAWPKDVDEAKALWGSQIHALQRVLGA